MSRSRSRVWTGAPFIVGRMGRLDRTGRTDRVSALFDIAGDSSTTLGAGFLHGARPLAALAAGLAYPRGLP